MAEFIPITELPSLIDTRISFFDKDGNFSLQSNIPGELAWDIALPPYVNADRIEVNMSRIRAIHRVGAMASSLVMQYSGETTKEEPSIVGMSANGIAIAGKSVSVRKAQRAKSAVTLSDDYETMPQSIKANYGKAIAIHELNLSEIAQTIQRRGGSIRNDAMWARELGKSLAESYRTASREHLTQRGTRFNKGWSYSLAAYTASVSAFQIMEYDYTTLPAWATLGLAINVGLDSSRLKYVVGDARLKDRRFSLLLDGIQTDRHLAVKALTHLPGGLMRLRKEPKIL